MKMEMNLPTFDWIYEAIHSMFWETCELQRSHDEVNFPQLLHFVGFM